MTLCVYIYDVYDYNYVLYIICIYIYDCQPTKGLRFAKTLQENAAKKIASK